MTGARVGIAAAAGALVVALGEAWLAARAGRPAQDVVLYAFAAGAATLWVVAVVQLIHARFTSLSRQQIAQLEHGAEQLEHFARISWERILRLQRANRLLLAEPLLADLERQLAGVEAAIEATTQRAQLFATWRDLAGEWMRCAGPIVPDIANDITPADQQTIRETRRGLPTTQTLSSADLRATVMFVIEKAQLAQARARLDAVREMVREENGFARAEA